MRKIFNILAVIFFAFTIMAPGQVFANDNSHRDAVYASEDKPHGGGIGRDTHLKDSSDVSKTDVGAKTVSQLGQTEINGIENTCAWRHEGFRNAYLSSVSTKIGWLEENMPTSQELPQMKARYAYLSAIANNPGSGNTTNGNSVDNNGQEINGIGQVASISQDTHDFTNGYDSSEYKMQNISVNKLPDYIAPAEGNACEWAENNHLFSNEFAIVFPEDYNKYDNRYTSRYYNANIYKRYYDIQCNVPLIIFCSKNVEIVREYSFSELGNNIDKSIYGTPHIFFVNSEGEVGHSFPPYVFQYSKSNITIGNGNHVFNAEQSTQSDFPVISSAFSNTEGNIYIGKGNHQFLGYSFFYNAKGDITIDDGNHYFYDKSSIFNSIKSKNVYIGNGNYNLKNAFYFTDSNIYIGNGRHELSGFNNTTGKIEIGTKSNVLKNEFIFTTAFNDSSSTIHIGNGNHTIAPTCAQHISCYAFKDFKGKLTIGNGKLKVMGKSPFYNVQGTIYIGDGNHEFIGESSIFYKFSGIIDIGKGNHIFGGGAFQESTSTGKIHIGKGNTYFQCKPGWSTQISYDYNTRKAKSTSYHSSCRGAFTKSSANIRIERGNHTFEGYNPNPIDIPGTIYVDAGINKFLAGRNSNACHYKEYIFDINKVCNSSGCSYTPKNVRETYSKQIKCEFKNFSIDGIKKYIRNAGNICSGCTTIYNP